MSVNEQDKVEIEIEEIDDDSPTSMSEPFDPNEIQIHVKQESLRNISERLAHNEIDMDTFFQRNTDLWNATKMSRLIESILINFPLPAFYLDVTDNKKWLVVDGLQRLSAIKKFVVDKKMKLSSLEFLSNLEGLDFDNLPRDFQRRINECNITTFQISPGTPEKVKYNLFRRINTGGLVLNNQEIRNALASDQERDFLNNLSQNKTFLKIMGDQSKRYIDHEFILRFSAFYCGDYLSSKKGIAEFLDDEMNRLQKASKDELTHVKKAFERAIDICFSIFDVYAFEKRTSEDSKRKRKSSALYEVWMVCTAKLTNSESKILIDSKVEVNKALINLIETDNEFVNAISYSTHKPAHVKERYFKIQNLIKEVLDDQLH